MTPKEKCVVAPETETANEKETSMSSALADELVEAEGRLSEIVEGPSNDYVATVSDTALEGLLDQGDEVIEVETSEAEGGINGMDAQEDNLCQARDDDDKKMSPEDQAEMMKDTQACDVPESDVATVDDVDPGCIIEAVLFAADEAFSSGKLAAIVDCSAATVEKLISTLNEKYTEMGCAFSIEAVAGGFQMLTNPKYHIWLVKLLNVRNESKLSAAAMETLAIVAYKQPVMRVDIENIRGVACGEMIRQLSEKGLVKIAGRAEELGRPILYGTTKKFLEIFGLCNLKELPDAQDSIKPDKKE